MIPIDKSFVASKGCCASHMLHDFQPLTYIYTTILLMFYSVELAELESLGLKIGMVDTTKRARKLQHKLAHHGGKSKQQ